MYNRNQKIKKSKIKTVKILFSPVNLINRGAKTSIKIKSLLKKAYTGPAYCKFNYTLKNYLVVNSCIYCCDRLKLNKKYNSLKSTLKPLFCIFNYILMSSRILYINLK